MSRTNPKQLPNKTKSDKSRTNRAGRKTVASQNVRRTATKSSRSASSLSFSDVIPALGLSAEDCLRDSPDIMRRVEAIAQSNGWSIEDTVNRLLVSALESQERIAPGVAVAGGKAAHRSSSAPKV